VRHDIYAALKRCLAEDRSAVVATVLTGPLAGRQLLIEANGPRLGSLGSAALDDRIAGVVRSQIPLRQRSEKIESALDGARVEVFIDVHLPRPQLVAIGAVHVAVPLVSFARIMGFRTVVIDPRSAFATRDRFQLADALIADWPDAAFASVQLTDNTFVAVLSHDPKIDNPALFHALRSQVPYIGALGSTKTHQKRVEALRAEGFGPEDIARIHAPIGLDIGGRRAEDVALAIIAEIAAVRQGTRSRFGSVSNKSPLS
jgi:xanthine dehydrogenase accessory factor